MSEFNYKGNPITVRTDGVFCCKLADDLTVEADSLKELRGKLDKVIADKGKQTLTLPVVGVLSYGHGEKTPPRVHHAILTGVNRTSRNLQFADLPKGTDLDYPLADTPANHALLERWLEVDAEHTKLVRLLSEREVKAKGYGRLELGGEYGQLLKQVTADHKHSEKLGADGK